MGKRRTPEQIQRLLRDMDRDRAKGLTVTDFCRKVGITETSYYRWRQRFDPAKIDDTRRLRELQGEIERLKLLVAELLLDKRMLQEVAKKKVVTAVQQRAAASYLGEIYQVSQRRAARLLGRARSTLRYRPAERSRQTPLVKAMKRLAGKHPRWGYRFIHALLVRQGWQVNLKRVHRLWQELKLQRPVRRKAKKLGSKPGTSANSCVNRPARFQDDVWTYDFVADRTVSGSPLKWLTLVDEYTRECLALHVAAAVRGQTCEACWQG